MTTLAHPPESFRPDRLETFSRLGEKPAVSLASGVTLDILVGAHNGARNLTTGIATFSPDARLPYHKHTMAESITLLAGTAIVGVEGREYRLSPFDNVLVPAGFPHTVQNVSGSKEARFHVALASSTPDREWVPIVFELFPMPDASNGVRGKEHIIRFQTVERSEAGPGTEFIDYFNQTMVPGIEMSGGYGRFEPGGRLPAHFHDFDESICIVDGTATCIVEGRKRSMSDCDTALQPRGRVHYFVNESQKSMAMIWVYAGAFPNRIITAEKFATENGAAWT